MQRPCSAPFVVRRRARLTANGRGHATIEKGGRLELVTQVSEQLGQDRRVWRAVAYPGPMVGYMHGVFLCIGGACGSRKSVVCGCVREFSISLRFTIYALLVSRFTALRLEVAPDAQQRVGPRRHEKSLMLTEDSANILA